MKKNIALIKGDGIGPEVIGETIKVLDVICKKFGHEFVYTDVLMGGCAYDATGHPLPEETVRICKSSDSVLLGAVGGPKWDTLPGHLRPEAALLGLRAAMELYANIRPAVLYPALKASCPLRNDIADNGIDIVVVRELTGGIYFGRRAINDNEAFDTEYYTVSEIERIARCAFDIAKTRKGVMHSVDKANVLDSSRLWRKVVHELGEREYSDIKVIDILVDNAAMQLVRNPSQFDVLLANNMFGDILSDEAAMVTGSIGILPSSSLGSTKRGLYEPIHGSAPDIAGKNLANPIATILSAAMMLRMSFDMTAEASAVEKAVDNVLWEGYRTTDLALPSDNLILGTTQMGDMIAKMIAG